jgi:hypothetical protein
LRFFEDVFNEGVVDCFTRTVESFSGLSEKSSSVEEKGGKGTGDGALRGMPMEGVGEEAPDEERRCRRGTVEW